MPFATAVHQAQPWRQAVGVATLVVFGVLYLLIFQWARGLRQTHRPIPVGRARASVGLLLGLGLAGIPGTEGDWLTTLVFVAAAAVFLLPPVDALVVVVLAASTPPVTAALVPGWEAESTVVFAVLLASFAMFGVSRLAQRNGELRAAQAEIGRLAVAEERARTARDLHDILGHSLTVVAVKAELAGRLLALDPARAAAEIADVERLAGRRWPTCGAPSGRTGRSACAANWPGPGRRWPPRASSVTCRTIRRHCRRRGRNCSAGRSGRERPTWYGTAARGGA